MPKDNCERVPLYRFTIGHAFGMAKRDRNQVASSLAEMSPWGVPADVQLKDDHTITIDVYSPLTKEQHRMLSSQIPREAQRIKRYLKRRRRNGKRGRQRYPSSPPNILSAPAPAVALAALCCLLRFHSTAAPALT